MAGRESKRVEIKDILESENSEKLIASLSFEEGLKILEDLVSKLESGSLSLDSAVSSYEKGSKLIEKLRNLLTGAEEKLKILQVD